MKNKKIVLHIILILVIVIVVSFFSIKITEISFSIYGDIDYQELGLDLDSYDIVYYTVYNQDIFSEYKVYKISDYYKSENVNEIKNKLENSGEWSREKFYEYEMLMFYDRDDGKIIDIDRENLYYYNQKGINAIIDLKNLKLYYYKGIPYHHSDFSEILEVKTKNYINREIYSVRGGLQYDGTDYYVYKFDEENSKNIEETVAKSGIWSKEKLDDKILESFEYNSEIFDIQNGYYHYQKVCRTSDEYKKEQFTDDEATGYEIGVYDVDKHILYYYWTSY